MGILNKDGKNEPVPEAAKPEAPAPKVDYGIFTNSELKVDEETGMATAIVRREHGIIHTTSAPIPIMVAWSMDNGAGKILSAVSNVLQRLGLKG